MTGLVIVLLLACFVIGGVLWALWPRPQPRPTPGKDISIYHVGSVKEMPNATLGSLCIVGTFRQWEDRVGASASASRSARSFYGTLYVMTKEGWRPL